MHGGWMLGKELCVVCGQKQYVQQGEGGAGRTSDVSMEEEEVGPPCFFLFPPPPSSASSPSSSHISVVGRQRGDQ